MRVGKSIMHLESSFHYYNLVMYFLMRRCPPCSYLLLLLLVVSRLLYYIHNTKPYMQYMPTTSYNSIPVFYYWAPVQFKLASALFSLFHCAVNLVPSVTVLPVCFCSA